MSISIITDSDLTSIANAIREKNSSSDTYTPLQMATAITNLPSSGGESYTATTPNGSDVFLVAWDDVNEIIDSVYTADYPSGTIVFVYNPNQYELSITGDTILEPMDDYYYAFRMPSEDVTIH